VTAPENPPPATSSRPSGRAQRNALDDSLFDSGCHGFQGDHPDLYAAVESIVRAHVAEQVAAVVAGMRAEAWDEGWNTAVDSDGYPGDVNPYRERADRETP
jgi:hypothetical protein